MKYLLLIAPSFIWSTLIVVGRWQSSEIPPATLTFWTWLVAALALMPFVFRELLAQRRTVRREFGVLLLYAVLGPAVSQGLYFAGVERTTAINAALLSPMFPIIVACIAWPLLRERLSGVQVAGVAAAASGTLWISVDGEVQLLAALRIGAGDALIVAALACQACYTILLRKRPSALSPPAFMAVIALLGSVVTLPFCWWEAAHGAPAAISWKHVIAVLYIGIVTYDLAWIFWNISVERYGAGVAALFTYLIPVFGTVLAVIFLQESVAGYHALGIALIFVGIHMSLHRRVASGAAPGSIPSEKSLQR